MFAAALVEMKITYDSRTDTLTVLFRGGARIVESDETRLGVILDYDERDYLVSIEILDASLRVSDADRVDFERVE